MTEVSAKEQIDLESESILQKICKNDGRNLEVIMGNNRNA